jgi:glycosyltransferase involved in cell wall biosynthesis
MGECGEQEDVMPELSVIVPLYNTEKYISQCLSSILNQTFSDIEVIVVDDGSTDRSGVICEEFAITDKRLKVIHQQNQGVIRARYNGLRLSTSEYVVFVDSDDFVNKEAYIYAVPAMQRSVDAVLFEISRYYDEDNQKIEPNCMQAGKYDRKRIETEIYPKLIWDFEKQRFGMEMQLGVNIIKRELLLSQYEKIVDKKFWYGEDISIIYPLYKKYKNIEIIDKCYYQHRQRQEICWPYVSAPQYFDGLYELYRYLLSEFTEQEEHYQWRKQIEYFYMSAVELKKAAYGDKINKKHYLFPFTKVAYQQNVVLYGAGAVGKEYYRQLMELDYCKNLVWVDKNYDFLSRPEVVSPETILETEFDKLVIALENKDIRRQIRNDLISRGIEAEKIVF